MTTRSVDSWLLDGAVKDAQSITADWTPAELTLIQGVEVREVRHVPKMHGHLTEIFRTDWGLSNVAVDQIFQVVLGPNAISAWHAHEHTTDRLFVAQGLLRIVLYDARAGSRTYGVVNELKFGSIRPALVTVPPHVWHGIQNLADGQSTVINIVDRAYDYADPDHWRIAPDSPAIPFRWK